MGNAVALRPDEPQGTEVAVIRAPVVAAEMTWTETRALGQVLAASGYFKDVRGEAQAVTKILYGREIGIGPVTALMSVHVIEGKPAPSANLIAARIRASGRYDYRVREHTAEVCRVEFFARAGGKLESLGIVEWTIAEARAAGLAGKQVWKSYPRAMLFARALSEGARVHCPEVFGGSPVYTPEELGAEVNADGDPVGLTAPEPIGPEMMSVEQEELIGKLRKSHVFTDDEQDGIEKRLERGMTKVQAKAAIDWMLGELKNRKAAEAQAEREPGSDDVPPFVAEEIADQETLPLTPAPRSRRTAKDAD